MGRPQNTIRPRSRRHPAWGWLAAGAAALVAIGGLNDAAVGQPVSRQDLTPELVDLLDEPAPVAAAMVDIPTAVGIVQRNADLGLERLDALLDDPTAWADHDGRIFIVEPARNPAERGDDLDDLDDPPAVEGGTAFSSGAGDPVLAGTYPHSMAFELESRPGASRVIYLDFEGGMISGTAWNANYTRGESFYAEAYDTDGSPSTFSDSERAVIQSVWRRVAEDFAPFDVNVTTKDPGLAAIERTGANDQQFGTRVLISNTTTIYSTCGCSGVAYIGVFDITSWHSYYQPAWVFQRGTGSGAKAIAEAASHEAGHNLGLFHDGTSTSGYYTGQGSWAPIMGVGYHRPITQWSRGEYAGANNPEDDYAVMQTYGLPLVADDHGDTPGTASPLGSGSVEVTGIISTPADVDVFAMDTTGGTLSLTASPAAVSPNLDIALELLDDAGNVVATADPPSGTTNFDIATGLDASISVDVAAGTYYLRVEGTGAGDPLGTGYTDYGSLGRYRITGSIPHDGSPAPTSPTAVIDVKTTSGTAPLTVTLDGSSSTDEDGTIVDHSWDLGDGTSDNGPVVTHTYTNAGVFTAKLTVTDDDGLTATSSATITVGAALEPDRVADPEPEPETEPSVDVTEVRIDGRASRAGAEATAVVRVVDNDGFAAGGVAVSGILSLTALDGTTRILGTDTGITGPGGALAMTGPTVADTLRGEVFSFCVLTVTAPPGTIHDANLSSAPTCATWAHDRVPVYCRGRLATIVGSGRIRGTPGPDVIVGSSGPDIIRGLGGDDLICAGGGNDVVFGGRGNDRIYGGPGRDRLVGGPGRDVLVGGPGRDILVADRSDIVVRPRGGRIVYR